MFDSAEALRQNVRSLKPDGEDGFEGLLAAVLTELTKRSFALASAGSQQGKDGQSALDSGLILFEAKRYDHDVPKDKVYSKIFEIAADKTRTVELYIVGATCSISAQHVATLKEGARQLGVALVVLGWPESGLAELPVLLAMAPEISAQFIAEHTGVLEGELATQLAMVRVHPQFQARSDEILAILQQPSIAPPFALKDNINWLGRAFTDQKRARAAFGQALSPADPSISCKVDRVDLRTKVANTVFAKPDGVVTAILGADGNGKSWIFAQAWRHQPNQPLTIVIVPDDLNFSPSPEHCEDLLIDKLITQTGEARKSDSRERWLRHFDRWQRTPNAIAPRLVVFIDGVNQRDSVNWLRILDTMSEVVAQLGGKLVFSCRKLFYRDKLENRLISTVEPIDVPEWTDPELDALLNERGTSLSDLDGAIVRSLRNPRIFGVAAALFKNHEITTFGELSVNRLLFEHIRSGSVAEGSTISPKQFAGELCTHAERIVRRLNQRLNDGLNEFDMATFDRSSRATSEQFVIASAGRFFELVDENPNRYILKDDGLPLALGLALVRTAREALRKQRSVEEALSDILDPISALDRTGEILLGAIVSAVLEDSPKELVAPLVRSFVLLQNLDSSRYPEFRSLFSRDPDSFLGALEDSALSGDVTPNLSWLTDAANDLRGTQIFEAALENAIRRWLNMYSLSPDRMILVSNSQERAAERERMRAERQQKLSEEIAALSLTEHELLGSMIEESRGDYSRLSLLAFQALARRSLAPFAENLRNWCFAAALNGGYRDHHKDFEHLLYFNLADWAATKDALRDAVKPLRQTDISRTGRWALVYALRATGDSGDAEEADHIAEDLTRDRERFKGWRLIEKYCATDPCDPDSKIPDNIDTTASAYLELNPAELYSPKNATGAIHLFITAQPGLARFRPEALVEVLRAFADQAVTRDQTEFRQAVFVVDSHTVCLEDRVARPYVEKAREIAQAALDTGEDRHLEAWIAAQCALFVAFPHMSGDAQFDALVAHPRDHTVLLSLCHLFRPISDAKLEQALESAVRERNAVTQVRILCFAEYSRTPLTARTRKMAQDLLTSTHSHVRLSTLSLIRASADSELLTGLVESGWNASTLDVVSDKVEIFHGSRALVLAAERGAITLEACLERIAQSAFDDLANRLGPEAAIAIADRLDTAIRKASGFHVSGNLPEIEQNFDGSDLPVVFEVSERPAQDETPHDRLRRQIAGAGDAWYERQRRSQDAADRFERELAKAGAQLIIESITAELISAIDAAAPAMVDSWRQLFMKLEAESLDNVHNIASLVAEVISKRDITAALPLFARLSTSSAVVPVTFGRDKLGLDTVSVWRSADNYEMTELRFGRLDSIGNDHELAIEILAAIKAKRVNILRDYVMDRRQRAEPAHRARAAMVAGLSPDAEWAIETVSMLANEHGFLERAYEAAKYAMDRHRWSRHWAAQMRNATDAVDLARYAILLSKIVDARFQWSELYGVAPSPLIERFGPTLHDPIRNRIRKWKNARQSKLFGMNAPDRTFLPAA